MEMAASRTAKTSSLSARNKVRTFSALARWRSNLGSSDSSTVRRISDSRADNQPRGSKRKGTKRNERALSKIREGGGGEITRIGDGDGQQPLDDVADHLYRVCTSLVNDGVSDKQLAAGQGSRLSDLGLVVVDVVDRDVVDELVENVPWQEEQARSALPDLVR